MILHYEIQVKRYNAFRLKLVCTVDFQPDSKWQRVVLLLKEFEREGEGDYPVAITDSQLFTKLFEVIAIESNEWDIATNLHSYMAMRFDAKVRVTDKNKLHSDEVVLYNLKPVFQHLDKKLDFEHFEAAPAKPYITYDVFLGTNRKRAPRNERGNFGKERDEKLHLGKCEVSIPKAHESGHMERPNWFSELIFGERADRHFTVLNTIEKSAEEFERDVRAKLAGSTETDLMLFIHGYNTKHEQAVTRAAQLGYDLNFKGAVAAFTWPSLGRVDGYLADMDSARLSATYLRDFLKLLLKAGTRKLYIIAHSMGNVVLTEALLRMKDAGEYPTAELLEIILAAPDIDKDVFMREIMPKIGKATRLTLYASERDRALLASEKFRAGYDRIGQGGSKLTVVDDVECIDATQVNTDLIGHGYYAETEQLLNDIHYVLEGLRPDMRALQRKMQRIGGASKTYWSF